MLINISALWHFINHHKPLIAAELINLFRIEIFIMSVTALTLLSAPLLLDI